MTASSGAQNRGYLFPDKGKGRLHLAGRDVTLTCRWDDANRQRLVFEVTSGRGSVGNLEPNAQKANDKQPDWRGQLTDEQGQAWSVSVWTRDKNGDVMFSLAVTARGSQPTAAGASPAKPVSTSGQRNSKDFHPQAKIDMFESGYFGQNDAFWKWVDTDEAIPYIEAMAESRQPVAYLGVLGMDDDDADDLFDEDHLAKLRKTIQARYGKAG